MDTQVFYYAHKVVRRHKQKCEVTNVMMIMGRVRGTRLMITLANTNALTAFSAHGIC